MIGEHRKNALPFSTPSNALQPNKPVQLSTVKRSVNPVATNNVEIQGFTGEASVAAGGHLTVYGEDSVVEAVAAASLGAGADIAVASTNGNLGPAAAGASGVTVYRVGKSLEAAAAGEKFSLYVKPKQLSGHSL